MPQQEITSQKCMARALYDNVAEAPDELVFRKGDLLTVLEQNTSGIEGWWLCSLRGRQGICPGNRLKIVAGLYANEASEAPCVAEFNTLQKQGKRRSWNIQPNKVMTPQKVGDVFLYDVCPMQKYDVPRSQNWSAQSSCETYDVPPHPIPLQDYANLPSLQSAEAYDVPHNRPALTPTAAGDTYDIPRPVSDAVRPGGRLSPSSSISSLTTNSDSISSSSTSNRSSSFMSEYDVPRSAKLLVTQSAPPVSSRHVQELPVELQDAREHLQRAETEVVTSINKLISFASPEWRTREHLAPKLRDIISSSNQLQSSLHEFTVFAQRCLANASKCEDKNLFTKLNSLVNCLLDSDRIIHEACRNLASSGWNIDRLCRPAGEKGQPDSLDQLIVICVKSLLDHVKHVSTFIQGNSPLLFKRLDAAPGELTPDDYVKAEPVPPLTGEEGNYELLTNRHDVPCMDKFSLGGGDEQSSNGGYADKQTLLFFASQISSLSLQLISCIDHFLKTVEHNQPPRVFLVYSKRLILSGYRLVYIGDAVTKSLNSGTSGGKLGQCCSMLCETLSTTVSKTRRAAQQFPSVSAVQEMVDSVVDVSHVARDLKIGIVMCAQQA